MGATSQRPRGQRVLARFLSTSEGDLNSRIVLSFQEREAGRRMGMEFNTEEELKSYLQEHPKANRSKHRVKAPKAETTKAKPPKEEPEAEGSKADGGGASHDMADHAGEGAKQTKSTVPEPAGKHPQYHNPKRVVETFSTLKLAAKGDNEHARKTLRSFLDQALPGLHRRGMAAENLLWIAEDDELGGASATMQPDGHILVDPKIAKELHAKVTEEDFAELEKKRAGKKHKKASAEKAQKWREAVSTIVHEEIHGCGPVREYRGSDAAIEEVTTEWLARRLVDPGRERGAYQDEIERILAMGTDRAKAGEALVEASRAFKKLSSADSPTKTFTDLFHKELVKRDCNAWNSERTHSIIAAINLR